MPPCIGKICLTTGWRRDMWHKLRTLWFLCHALRWNDSLAWAMLTLMMGFGVYRGLSPDKARHVVMDLCDESPFLDGLTVGRVLHELLVAEPAVRHPGKLRRLERRMSDMQSDLGQQGEQSGEEACHG